ncbi:MAG TPA: GntR family transcriptional regulator [Amycolatopsis sp.]|nr:GntR family transcriptional regulator [Amycolatopsis sp.]
MARRGEAKSVSADVYQRIRMSIFNGSLRPGDRLQPAQLSQQYDASTTVVREALAQLAGERLVTSKVGQGYFIPTIEREELRDITTVRCQVESLAVRMSMERGGVEWESALLAAHHRLARTPRRTEDNPDHPSQEWATVHRAFHAQLVGACRVPTLLDVCEQLFSATELYRVWAGAVGGSKRDVEAEHAAILHAALAGDPDRTVDLLTAHYTATATQIIDNWPGADQASKSA